VALGKGAGAGSGTGIATGVAFGTSPWGTSAVCGAMFGMGLLFPLVLIASIGYLGYKAALTDVEKVPGSGFNPQAPATYRPLDDGRLFHPCQTTLTDACRNIAGT